MQQTDSTAHKLKPRLFHKSVQLQVHLADFHLQCEPCLIVLSDFQVYCCFWAVLSAKQPLYFKVQKWLPLTIILQLQLWSHYLGHLSHISATIWLIHQMLHDAQDEFTKETAHLQGLHQVLSILAKQFHLFLAQVLSLWTTILTGRILLLILLLIIQLIDLLLLLAHGQNFIGVIILMNSWPTYLVDSLILLTLIRPLVLILIHEELKPVSPIPSAVLSLTSLIISCSNITYISMLTWCNSTWTLQKLTSQWLISLE